MGLFDLFKKKKKVVELSGKDYQELVSDMLNNANTLVRQFSEGVTLDFSVESLHDLDQIIESNTEVYKESNDNTKRIMVMKIGSYIFEVARQNFGGKYYWYDNLDQPILITGQPEFEMSLLAYEKVKGRFENGPEDNIPFFFEGGYVQGVKNKANQMIV